MNNLDRNAIAGREKAAIDFRKPEISDREWIQPLLAAADLSGCHQNFTNIFAWAEIFNNQVALVGSFLVVKGLYKGSQIYFYPVGSGDLQPVFEAMRRDAAVSGHRFVLAGVTAPDVSELQRIYPKSFEIQVMRDGFDYVYLLDKMINLSGSKLQSKRNHIHKFLRERRDWRFEEITPDNIPECREMSERWCELENHNTETIRNETCAVRLCLNHFAALGLEGGLLRLEGRVIAYTIGEPLNSDTYVVHVEKAFANIRGAYQMINREFALSIRRKYPHMVYINREEDMGLEGLRKAKLSYHPDKMEEKFIVTFDND